MKEYSFLCPCHPFSMRGWDVLIVLRTLIVHKALWSFGLDTSRCRMFQLIQFITSHSQMISNHITYTTWINHFPWFLHVALANRQLIICFLSRKMFPLINSQFNYFFHYSFLCQQLKMSTIEVTMEEFSFLFSFS